MPGDVRSERTYLVPVILLCVTALSLRLLFFDQLVLPKPIRADAREYFFYALNLAEHGTFSKEDPTEEPAPDSWRSPGYPLVFALVILIWGLKHFYPVLIYLQIALSTLCVAMTYSLGRRLMPSWAALGAAGLVAFSPHLISTTSVLLTETLLAFMLLAGIQAYYLALERKTAFAFSLAALVLGYAYLINETCLFIPGLFALYTAYAGRTRERPSEFKKTLRLLGVMLFVFCLFPAVWMLRSSQLPEGARTGKGRAVATMSHGAYPGFVHENPALKYYPYRDDPLQPAFGASFKNFRTILWDRFKQRPLRYLSWYAFEKPYYLWSWDNLQSQSATIKRPGSGDIYIYPVLSSLYLKSKPANLTRQFMKLLHPFVLLLALIGVFGAARQATGNRLNAPSHRSPVFLFIILGYYTCLYTVFAPWPRYSVPLRPELYLCALWSLVMIRNRLFGKPTT